MQLFCGAYPFPINATEITGGEEVLWNAGGQPYARKKTIKVSGYLSGLGQEPLIIAESALRTALTVLPNPLTQPLTFFSDLGTVAPVSLSPVGSIEGVHIHDLEFSATSKEGEYTSVRNFSFRAEAEYPIVGSVVAFLDFRETLTFSGGGPIYRFRMAINGPPQKQQVYPASPYKVIQSGECTGYRGYKNPPAPIWPGALLETGTIANIGPTRRGPGQYQGYRTTWSYHFESASSLTGFPTLWIN